MAVDSELRHHDAAVKVGRTRNRGRGLRQGAGATAGLLLGALWLVPLLWTLATAFRPASESVAGGLLPERWTLETLTAAWGSAAFPTYYVNTVIISTGIIAVQLVTSVLAAYAFARLRFPGRGLLFSLYLLQLMIPISVVVIPNYVTMKNLHLLDQLIAIMLPYFGSAMGTFFLRQSFRAVPIEYEEAARLEGAGTLRVIWHLYLPSARSAALAFLLVSFSYHWDDFFWPLVVTSSDSRRPLSVGLALFTLASETGANWQLVAAATVLVIAPVLLLFLMFQRQFIQAYATGLQ